MTTFKLVAGFEDLWKLPREPRPKTPLRTDPLRPGGHDVRARLQRVVTRAPEVFVRATAKPSTRANLIRRLDYITRNGELAATTREGDRLSGRKEMLDLADDWSLAARLDPARTVRTPIAASLILALPSQAQPEAVTHAARRFAEEVFEPKHDYVVVTHPETFNPHVHLMVRALGDSGERLRMELFDLIGYRGLFARALRECGVEAEATPRRARGIARKSETLLMQKLRRRYEAGAAPAPHVLTQAYLVAAKTAFGEDAASLTWQRKVVELQTKTRALYHEQAELLCASQNIADRQLGRAVQTFVETMPDPQTRNLALSREIRQANDELRRRQDVERDGALRREGRER